VTDFPLLVRRGKVLEYFTIAYNCLEGVIAIAAGVRRQHRARRLRHDAIEASHAAARVAAARG
jgi:hypothetical protein